MLVGKAPRAGLIANLNTRGTSAERRLANLR
jgi:hypothetical protein